MAKAVEQFYVSIAIFTSSFENCHFNSLAHLLIEPSELFVPVVFNFWSS
jgi:hypothetical protein